MVNNLLNDHGNNKRMRHETNLSKLTEAQWNKLAEHLKSLDQPLTRCCFQCGMLNYPKKDDTIIVENVTCKRDCRAYRVFEYYIEKLQKDQCDKLSHGATEAEVQEELNRIFLCEKVSNGCRVIACTACKRLCRDGSTDNNHTHHRRARRSANLAARAAARCSGSGVCQ